MIRLTSVCAAAAVLVTATNATAIDLGLGIFKKKQPQNTTPAKADPSVQAKQLVTALQSSTDVEQRKSAAEALRHIDPRSVPEVITSLVAAVQNDPSPSVRLTAVNSIGSIKSVYPTAGAVLENSEKNDPDMNVRNAAKAALWNYHLNGYKSSTTATAVPIVSPEPPLATRAPVVPNNPAKAPQNGSLNSDLQFRPITQGVGKGSFYQPTNEPPLANPPGQSRTTAPVAPLVIPAPEVQKPDNPDPVIQPIPSIPSGTPTVSK